MGFTIAVAGKGGTGKTSLCGLTIRYLKEKKRGAILAVDADANANLNDVLGVKVHATVGKLRETSLEAIKSTAPRPGGMSMEQLFDYQIQQALIEAEGFDLLVMGRPEGSGCYCAANNIIRKYMDKLADTYPFIVMDNEAGLEHLSRRTTQDTDLLLIISDSSVRGIMTAGRIGELVKELKLNIKRAVLIVNRVQDRELDSTLQKVIDQQGVEFAGFVPADELIFDYDLNGKPLIQLPPDSKALTSYFAVLDKLIP
ncbi:MAG: AAA family ATPase [Nitrospirae bacterium]|nr:AAA family ATPase [Nitrospirota bacterium]